MPDIQQTVYLHYTQAELDKAYDQRAWAPNADEVIRRYGTESESTRKRFAAIRDVSYGPGSDETLDVFPAARSGAPVHIHVHGGGWRNLTKNEESFLANALVPAGFTLVVLNFSTIPKVRIPEMVAQNRRAVAWLYRHVRDFGGDPDQMHLSGHSSGGHLASVLLTTDWRSLGVPQAVLKSGLLMSGMYDLRPVMLSARRSYVTLSEAETLDFSAILHLDRIVAPLMVAYGSLETPEFIRQAHSFVEAVRNSGRRAGLIDCGAVNHYELLELLGRPGTVLSDAAVRLMQMQQDDPVSLGGGLNA